MVTQVSVVFPEKIGIGAVAFQGSSRMLEDISAVGANWFYTWAPSISGAKGQNIGAWDIGTDAEIVSDDSGDGAIVFGETGDAWMVQDVAILPGEAYTLSISSTGMSSDARGGAFLYFYDAQGQTVASEWVPLGSGSGISSSSTITAPSNATDARVLLWGEAGALEIDNVSLTSRGNDLLLNPDLNSGKDNLGAGAPEFVHMVWGKADATAATMAGLGGADTILGFNEPDHRDQSNMTVDEALDLWPLLMDTGARLGSPSPTQYEVLGSESWLGRFMSGADQAGYRVDFVAVHYYSDTGDVAEFETFLRDVHDQYGKPVWVTEWALADWFNQDRFTADDNAEFFVEATQMMDGLQFVEKHAWFGLYDGMDDWNISTELVTSGGDLTTVGQAFQSSTEGVVLADLAPEPGDDPSTPPADTGENEAQTEPTPANGTEQDADTAEGSDTAVNEIPDDDPQPTPPEETADAGGAPEGTDTGTEPDGGPFALPASDDTPSFDVEPVIVAEYGTASLNHSGATITLDNGFVDPVVIATVTSTNGNHPVSVRMEDVRSDQFTLYLDEPNYLDGTHVLEDVSWIVVESGAWIADGGMTLQAGSVTTNTLSHFGTTEVAFAESFTGGPAVFTTDQTSNGSDMIWTRATDVSTSGFELVMEEEEALNSGRHVSEEIGWLAIERGKGMVQTEAGPLYYEASDAGWLVDSSRETLSFDMDFNDAPVLLAGVSSRNGTDSTGLRLDELSNTGALAFLQEEQSLDKETNHLFENVDWLALEGSGEIHGVSVDTLFWGA